MLASASHCDTDVGTVKDRRGYCTVLYCPELNGLTDVWRDIILADGDLLPGEVALIREKCPRAHIHAMQENPLARAMLKEMDLPIDTLRQIYRRVIAGGSMTASVMAQDCGVTVLSILTAVQAFADAGLVEFVPQPYAVRPVTIPKGEKRDIEQTPVIRYIRAL